MMSKMTTRAVGGAILAAMLAPIGLTAARAEGRPPIMIAPPPFLSQLEQSGPRPEPVSGKTDGYNEPTLEPAPTPSFPVEEVRPLDEKPDAGPAGNTAPEGRVYLTGDSFREEFEGRTVHLRDLEGVYYGSEQFLSGNRSVWTFRGETCQDGIWRYTASEQFCFFYGADGPHCWYMYREGGKLYAEGIGGLTLEIYDVDSSPIGCQKDRIS